MRIELQQLVDKHKDTPCVVAAHGPSLNLDKGEIVRAHDSGNILRFSVNEWWDYFDAPPDYWVLATTILTIERMLPIINKHKIFTLYTDVADFTPLEFVEENVLGDWVVYDQRHWQGKTCMQILNDFREHYEEHKDFNFLKYGNNKTMWAPPRNQGNYGHCVTNKRCCKRNVPARKTVQETLQELSGCEQHYSTGDSVSLHAIAFAIIMGCNPIYVTGLDLDYRKGYANKEKSDWKESSQGPNAFTPVRQNFLNDLEVLNKSAELRGIKIVNLNPDAWYNSFEFGNFTY